MKTIEKSNQEKYYVVFNDNYEPFHYGVLEVGLELNTGLSYLESFMNQSEWIDRIDEVKGEGYYQSTLDDEAID